jgi:hypothetical protein
MKANETNSLNPDSFEDPAFEALAAEIMRSIKNVRFGSVEITIHDSRVVQIERKEKVRLTPAPRLRAD